MTNRARFAFVLLGVILVLCGVKSARETLGKLAIKYLIARI